MRVSTEVAMVYVVSTNRPGTQQRFFSRRSAYRREAFNRYVEKHPDYGDGLPDNWGKVVERLARYLRWLDGREAEEDDSC